MTHETCYEDGGSADLYSCGDVALRERHFTLTAPEYNMGRDSVRECPNCHKKLRLVWDVRIEEVE